MDGKASNRFSPVVRSGDRNGVSKGLSLWSRHRHVRPRSPFPGGLAAQQWEHVADSSAAELPCLRSWPLVAGTQGRREVGYKGLARGWVAWASGPGLQFNFFLCTTCLLPSLLHVSIHVPNSVSVSPCCRPC